MDKILEFIDKYDCIACYGAGRYAMQVVAFLLSMGRKIDCFVETLCYKPNSNIGIPIISLDELKEPTRYHWIIGVSEIYKEEVTANLRERGVSDYFYIDEDLIREIARSEIVRNASLYGAGLNKRCFILGMGPSISNQDLSLLRNEVVLSCSWCGLLKSYENISPEYFFSPAAMNDPVKSKDELFQYGKEVYMCLSEMIKSPIIIMDYRDKIFVEALKVFKDKQVYYIDQSGTWDEEYDFCDLTHRTPEIQTATVMMLKAAIYMGFEEIFLLGAEHNITNRSYGHSYDLHRLVDMGYEKAYDICRYSTDLVEKKWSVRKLLRVSLNIYEEYHALHQLSEVKGIKIYNATEGGDLDEFERINYISIFE